MLPSLHCQHYEAWIETLEGLKDRVERGDNPLEEFTRVQQLYQEKILPLSQETIDSAIAPRWRSLQTEIHRTFRLLQTDLIFLNASRQQNTLERRRTTCLQRLDRLLDYLGACISPGLD